MTRRTIASFIATGVAVSVSMSLCAAAIAKPHRKPRPAPTTPSAPATPPSVASPPALSNEPEPTPAPSTPAPAPVASPTPAPVEPPPAAKSKSSVELETLVTEYTAIRDELFRSRAKGAVLGDALLKTQLVVTFRYEAGRAWPLKKVTLKLDERPVYSGESVNGTDPQKVFETVAAAGRHVLTARVEATGVGEDRISYSTEDSFGIDIADGKLTRVEVTVDESGSGPEPLSKKKAGSFDVRVTAKVKSLEIEKK